MPEGDVAVSAVFEPISYSVSVSDSIENGSVSADKTTSHYDDTVKLTVTPNKGYALKTLTVKGADNNEIPVTNNQFRMPDGNVTVSAEFETGVEISYIDINGTKTKYMDAGIASFSTSTFSLPPTPYLDGNDFRGWTVNGREYTLPKSNSYDVIAEINSLVKGGQDVEIGCIYEKKTDCFDVTVINGKLENGNTQESVQVSSVVKVTADEIAGQKFLHWIKGKEIVSCNKTYSFFMPSETVSIEAVFVPEGTSVEATGTGFIESVTLVDTNKLAFVSVLNVPVGYQMEKAGIVAKSTEELEVYCEELTADNAKFVRYTDTSNNSFITFKYTWTLKLSTPDKKWTVRPYLEYSEKDNPENKTVVYGDAVSYCLDDFNN